MQMNVLYTKQVSHVGSRDDHGQPIAGGDDQKCRRRVGSRSTGIRLHKIHKNRDAQNTHIKQTSEGHAEANTCR